MPSWLNKRKHAPPIRRFGPIERVDLPNVDDVSAEPVPELADVAADAESNTDEFVAVSWSEPDLSNVLTFDDDDVTADASAAGESHGDPGIEDIEADWTSPPTVEQEPSDSTPEASGCDVIDLAAEQAWHET